MHSSLHHKDIHLLGLDPGINNLGICSLKLKIPSTTKDVNLTVLLLKSMIQEYYSKVINICQLKHTRVAKFFCSLGHSKEIVDRLDHVFQEEECFDECDKIIMERQPPRGLTVITNLAKKQFPDKSEILHPSSMHKWFEIYKKPYTERKLFYFNLMKQFVTKEMDPDLYDVNVSVLENTEFNRRQQDKADSFALLIFYLLSKYFPTLNRTTKVLQYSNSNNNNNILKTGKRKIKEINNCFDDNPFRNKKIYNTPIQSDLLSKQTFDNKSDRNNNINKKIGLKEDVLDSDEDNDIIFILKKPTYIEY